MAGLKECRGECGSCGCNDEDYKDDSDREAQYLDSVPDWTETQGDNSPELTRVATSAKIQKQNAVTPEQKQRAEEDIEKQKETLSDDVPAEAKKELSAYASSQESPILKPERSNRKTYQSKSDMEQQKKPDFKESSTYSMRMDKDGKYCIYDLDGKTPIKKFADKAKAQAFKQELINKDLKSRIDVEGNLKKKYDESMESDTLTSAVVEGLKKSLDAGDNFSADIQEALEGKRDLKDLVTDYGFPILEDYDSFYVNLLKKVLVELVDWNRVEMEIGEYQPRDNYL